MHKPGLGARKCGTCGARIEGPQSHLLRECPQCRTSLYGRFVPAPAAPPASKSGGGGSGAIVAVVGLLGLGAIGALGAVAYVLSTKKASATTVSAPPSANTAGPTPLLAETAAPSASASANAHHTRPSDHVPTATTTKPPPTATTSGGFFLRPPPSASAPPPNGAQRCTATMTVSNFRPSSSTCSFNEKVRQGPGRLDFPCDGGTATATFGSQVFSGSVTSSFVSLTQSEPFNFNGCSVVSTQRIVGARSSSQASYSYSERIVGGECSGVTTCRATATIEIR